ncbi:organic anion transporter 3-like [Saccostrea cucullata]|uniref:organic anion transporter 3-like n=1 Tax=Saccostrea cuccullata TaxID=36930 RepID=UPI002ED26D6E
MIGKFGITGAYSLSYLYSSEIFPTVVRNQAVGLSSFFENLGGIAAPLIVYATSSSQSYIPLVVFGVIMVVGGILACFLPETHKKPLPETIEDVEHFTRGAATQTEDTYL